MSCAAVARRWAWRFFFVDLGFAQGVLQDQRVDFGQPLALLDLVADLDLQGFELAGNLGADIDLLDAFEQAGGQDGVFDVTALGGGGQVLRRVCGGLHGVDGQGGGDCQGQGHSCFAKL
ncbi:hypothetical protein QF039_003469 [Pseudomonas sp. W2I6]|nr:hypothetical protein [Pseudomonas sp. W2I6]